MTNLVLLPFQLWQQKYSAPHTFQCLLPLCHPYNLHLAIRYYSKSLQHPQCTPLQCLWLNHLPEWWQRHPLSWHQMQQTHQVGASCMTHIIHYLRIIDGFKAPRLPRQATHTVKPLQVSISNNHNWPEFYPGNAWGVQHAHACLYVTLADFDSWFAKSVACLVPRLLLPPIFHLLLLYKARRPGRVQ